MKRLVLALALLLPAAAGAQAFKCADKAGKITYSSQPCKEIGLSSAGEVQDKITVVPAQPVAPPPKPGAPKPSPAGMAPPAPPAPSADAAKKDEPERRCFQVKTAKGFATRCNDKPEEDEAKK